MMILDISLLSELNVFFFKLGLFCFIDDEPNMADSKWRLIKRRDMASPF